MTEIVLENLGKSFGDFTALADMSLTIEHGEFVALLGPSGCGKSTTMNMIAGMLDPSVGLIKFDGRPVNNIAMSKRGVGFVFQNYAIFTHMSVRENLSYGLKANGVSKTETQSRVQRIAEFLQLEDLLDRPASGLSVNILQRIAIGRSAIMEPAIFLLDEPLSNVDAAFRAVMRTELKQLQRQFKQTMVYVTHDQLEAMTMADRIAVMDHGKLLQVGTPLEVYNHPANTFVAEFIGSPGMNLLAGTISSREGVPIVDLGEGGYCAIDDPKLADVVGPLGTPVTLGYRPELTRLHQGGTLGFKTTFVERIGSRTILHIGEVADGQKLVVSNQVDAPEVGGEARFSLQEKTVRLFESETGKAIGGTV